MDDPSISKMVLSQVSEIKLCPTPRRRARPMSDTPGP
eukprot:CAMPEP_0175986626 /NCGR_PEP_ID=MMETSP0108-20121206/50248_1 /TAXON_ID=195067 ORGANISM="Goniomonas pacifica, Strain CCMP1869" /NCGR_SAMPLE_ID=MMETSP0108 /ASSEMBLY_ACC=CAM_ASM_000204 /LENGTH=36 /DNA_ID= /DNA_START= /DNA_END= /DNA_ORIENTATION=